MAEVSLEFELNLEGSYCLWYFIGMHKLQAKSLDDYSLCSTECRLIIFIYCHHYSIFTLSHAAAFGYGYQTLLIGLMTRAPG